MRYTVDIQYENVEFKLKLELKMGRSKFPGKPSKHINRKRVNVLPPNGEGPSIVDSVTVTEDKQLLDIQDSTVVINHANVRNIPLKKCFKRNMQNSKNSRSKNAKRNLISRICSKNVMKGNIIKKIKRKKNGKKIDHKCYTTLKNISHGNQRESGNLGKFILPSRSVHSSRVIKPNKRFMDINETLTRKQKNFKRYCSEKNENAEESNNTKNIGKDISESESCSNKRRIILRQARLQFHSQTYPLNSQGPFSSNSTNGSAPGTVTCGVCGAVRFYRFIKQARKFNIYSCESCRKFISKMIKRQSCNKSSALVCHKGQGTCHVPPIVRSQQWKLIKCAYRARCPACWLKMCLRSFQMPVSLRNNLSLLLPPYMQTPDSVFGNSSLFFSSGIKSVNVNISKAATSHSADEKCMLRPLRSNNNITTAINNNPPLLSTEIKRQKVDLKGPRVKHVCRSASIVLGQQVATFSEVERNRSEKFQGSKENLQLDEKITEKDSFIHTEKNNINWKDAKADFVSSEPEPVDRDKYKFSSVGDISISQERRDRSHRITSQLLAEGKSHEKNKTSLQMQQSISIDFWENYDPEDISQNGFSLISCEQFSMPSICFLCGSAGLEALLHCSACCEPYHPFCLEQTPQLENNYNIKQFMWLCPRCTVCSSCNESDRTKVNCQKCFKAYHVECLNYGFNTKWPIDDRPNVCSKCLRCRSCGTENITKFVGNLPLCLTCLKLRKKGNFCPLCLKCYYENDYCSKMMECANCNKWVHSKCEGLLEEQYQILSFLPDSIEYICRLCAKNSTPLWRKAVDAELKASFSNVLRLLSKNKIARDLLKWSPLSNNITTIKGITTVKKFQFIEQDDTAGIDIQNNNTHDNIPVKSIELKASNIRTMLDVKNKLNCNEYHSVREYNMEMEEALNHIQSEQILKIYRSIMHTIFPWYENSQQEKLEHITVNTIAVGSLETSKGNVEMNYMPQIELSLNDIRICGFCKGVGDGLGDQESRLLYCGQNEWVHANCALWSSEVYEEIDGYLQNVHSALLRGRSIKCGLCKQKGASVGCCFKGCYENYHFICARRTNCIFFHDKTVFCASHQLPKNCNVIASSQDFDIRRSIYVELDKKKGKYCEIEKVNFMVGSLCVTKLGKIHPLLSDGYDAIIPIGFVCSRLFWSTIEPWKLVCYNITTSPYNSNFTSFFADKNFTIDHSLPQSTIEKKFKELAFWQKDLEKRKNELMDLDDDEEPQNTADILSPELTDAILKELPHDLLDGISVQDIIPKLMPFEDLQTIDTSNSETSIIDDSDIKFGRELKRCKSDIILQMNENLDKMSRERRDKSQPRACSVTLSCKFDRAVSPTIKKRKIVPSHENNLYFKLLQVDGNFDDSASECGSPTSLGAHSWQIVSEEPVTCEKCHCTYRTQASYKRHLDNCELLCTSESDSELAHEHENNSYQESRRTATCMNAQLDRSILVENSQPMLINSYEAFQNQLQTSVLNTYVKSKSTQLIPGLRSTPDMIIQNTHLDHKSILPTIITNECNLQPLTSITPITINQQGATENHSEQTFTITQQNIPINEAISVANNQSITLPNNSFCVNPGVPMCVNQPVHLQTNTLTVNQSPSIIGTSSTMLNPVTLNQITQPNIQQTVEFQQPVTIQSVPFTSNVSQPMINISTQNQISLNGKVLANNNILNSVVTQAVTMPTNQWIKPIAKLQEKMAKSRTKTKAIFSKRSNFRDNETIVIPTQNPSAPSVIVQHLPSTSFVPAFVDTFQQQTGQNLQYIATISPQINQTIQSQPIVQIQPENNLISLVPGMQPVIIQQPRILENQLVMDSNGNISWAQAPQTVQPVYYGFETIVQNTVMQSQQFLPTTVPGVLTANSSYSTTTQVFQTSKLEPVLDVSSNSFVLVNPGQLITSQPSIDIPRYSQPVRTITSTTSNNDVRGQPVKYSIVSTGSHNKLPQIISQPVNTNSINLPTAPFVQEQGIPTNVVTPTPKVVQVQNRPMNRVLPMQTAPIKEKNLQKTTEIQKLHEVLKPNFQQLSNDTYKAIELAINPVEKQISCKEIPKSFMNTQSPIVTNQKPILNNQKSQEISKNFAKTSPLLEIQKTVDSLQTPAVEKLKYSTDVISSTDGTVMSNLDIPDYVNQLTRSPIFENIPMEVRKLSSTENISQNSSSIENFPTPPPVSQEKTSMTVDTTYFDEKESPKIPEDHDLLESLIRDQQMELSEKAQIKPSQKENIDTKNESLRIVFQKQSRDGTYKISNNISSKISNVQIAPLKPIKSNNTTVIQAPLSQINNKISSPPLKYTRKDKKPTPTISEQKILTQEKKTDPQSILYTIETQDGFRYSSTCVSELWTKVFETVQNARAAHNMPPLPEQCLNAMNNLQVLGLRNNGLKYLLEQLPAVSKCSKYKPSHHFPPMNIDLEDEYAVGHSFGAIRCAPHTKRYNQYDMFGWLSSKHRRPENTVLYDMELPRRGSINNLPMAMRFRQLKLTSKYSVGVYRSNIHGRGLFCLRDIEAGEMVIEYSGEVIRSILCDKREKEYNQKGIGCYMFRIDDNLVVDATMKGNAARFINHSCDPNCYSKVVEILGHKHIIIFALRRIMYSEELTYDYKFPFEEDKIPCTCGTRRCRKFLN